MQFSTSVIATALLGLVAAQKVHVVSVSSANKSLAFYPDNLKPAVGDMVQFQFLAGNHSVVQSNFDNPCTPIQQHDSTQKGMFSGYMNVAASAATGMIPTYTMNVTTDKPLWIYCSQGKHCQAGMVMVLNENTAANASRSLAAFKELSAKAPQNLDPIAIGSTTGGATPTGAVGGTTSTIPSPTGSASGTPAQALGSMVSVSAWTGLLSIAAALAIL
ncbi:extracellular serine-rich protein [Xylaria flabelliformis]|nr:extracellular serine-rich protein [Xylaria flabelliformis]